MGLLRQIPIGVTPVFLPRRRKWIVGVDLGTAVDYTAVSILEDVHGVLDWNTPEERHTNTGLVPQKPEHRGYVRHLQRYELGLSYPQIIDRVIELLSRPPLCGDGDNPAAELVVDDSGVGRPVSDMLVDRGLKPVRVTIVGGMKAEPKFGNRWHVPKELLITGLDAALHAGTLIIAKELTESHALKNELVDFRRTVSGAGRASFSARSGQHDDLILSVAISNWWARKPHLALQSLVPMG